MPRTLLSRVGFFENVNTTKEPSPNKINFGNKKGKLNALKKPQALPLHEGWKKPKLANKNDNRTNNLIWFFRKEDTIKVTKVVSST